MNWEVLELPVFLSSHLQAFCSLANLLCLFNLLLSLDKHEKDSNFAGYSDRNFTNYGMDQLGGTDSFQKYSSDENIPVNSFRRYSRDSTGHKDNFINYTANGNVVDQSFNSYGTGATGGSGVFSKYAGELFPDPHICLSFSLLFLSLSLSLCP
jgi:hypothetical protein